MTSHRSPISRSVPALAGAATILAVGLSLLLPLLTGCGKRSPDKAVLATVGDAKITQAYYESRLRRLKEADLPRDPATGRAYDMASLAGKRAFLDVIVNKELMVLKAGQLGLGADEQVAAGATAILEFNAPTIMHHDLIEKPSSQVTDQEMQDYYEHLKTQRRCSYVLCNFEEDAVKARAAIVAGGLWEDVADEYNDGSRGPSNNYTFTVKFGTMRDDFEKPVWELKEGEISQPIPTVYGWWVIRVDAIEENRVPPFEELKDRVRESVRARKINLARRQFVDASLKKHEFKMDEGALWTIFQGLPEGEIMLDPVTNKPIPREQLRPLNIPLAEMDKLFYQIKRGGQMEVVTVGDYKARFDQMNVFERPKRTDMLGGVRSRIMEVVERQLLLEEARERGYFEDPRATGDMQEKKDQMMITKLHDTVIKYDEAVTAEDLEQFWSQHAREYDLPESRFGRLLYCVDQATAEKARAAATGGTAWEALLREYGQNPANRPGQDQIGPVPVTAASPIKDALFSLATPGEVSPAFASDKMWAIVRYDSTRAARARDLSEMRTEVGQRIRALRKDEALKRQLEQWRAEFPVRVNEKQLAKVRSHAELLALPEEDNPLRRMSQR